MSARTGLSPPDRHVLRAAATEAQTIMRIWLLLALSFVLGGVSSVLGQGGDVKPLPLPKTIRVQSAAPRGEVWAKLSPKEKMLAYHLIQAANAGRELLFQRTHRHSLTIKSLLEEALSQEQIQKTKSQLGEKAFQEFVVYGAKFLDQGGPYTPSNRKYVLEQVTQSQVQALIDGSSSASRLSRRDRAEIARLLCDPQYEVQQAPESPDGKGLEKTGSNFYEKGITGPEVMAVLDKTLKPNINSRVIRSDKGLACETLTTQSPGVVGAALQKVVAHLQAARPYALTAHQKEQIEAMIKYFQGGDVEDFRQASIAWVRDRADSRVDFMIGWVEFEGDFLSRMAAWESYVQIVDPEISRLAQSLAQRRRTLKMPCPMARSRKSSPPIIRRLPSWFTISRRSPASVPAATISPISTTFAAMSAPRTSFACRCRVKMPIRRSKRCAAKPSRSFCRPARSIPSWQTGRGVIATWC